MRRASTLAATASMASMMFAIITCIWMSTTDCVMSWGICSALILAFSYIWPVLTLLS